MDINRIEYKVIEDKGIVVATIRNIEWDPSWFFNTHFLAHASASFQMLTFFDQKFCMPYSMKAVAKCHPNDQFDVEKGKAIARKKLINNYNASIDRHITHYRKALQKCMDEMDIYLKKHKMI